MWREVAANTGRLHWAGDGTALGLLAEPSRVNLGLNPRMGPGSSTALPTDYTSAGTDAALTYTYSEQEARMGVQGRRVLMAGLSPLALDVIGIAYDEEGEALPGWHVNAVWDAAPGALEAVEIAPAEAPRWWAGVPPVPPEPGPPTLPELVAAVDDFVECVARSMGYNGAAHCAGYVSSTVPQWAAEAAAFIAWRDAVWLTAYALDPLAMPASVAELVALLPAFERPGE